MSGVKSPVLPVKKETDKSEGKKKKKKQTKGRRGERKKERLGRKKSVNMIYFDLWFKSSTNILALINT